MVTAAVAAVAVARPSGAASLPDGAVKPSTATARDLRSGAAGQSSVGGRRIPPPGAAPTREQAAGDARGVVRRHRSAVRGADREEYQVRGVLVDPDGSRHVRFDRTYRGLPVLGGDFVVHANPDGSFRDASVAQRKIIAVATKPAIDATAAARRAFPGAAGKPSARLVVDAAAGAPALAWQVALRERNVIVDARSGAVRRGFDDAHPAESGTGHTLYSGTVPLSTTRRDDGNFTLTDPARGGARTLDALDALYPEPQDSATTVDADNVWGDGTRVDRATVAADVHYGMAQTFDFFQREFGRNGVRDDGTAPVAMVHQHSANAHYVDDCYCMSFGDGDATTGPFVSLDIVAHEWAHGVTAATAGLVYDGEPGALNEATSDIFGTLVEFAAGNPLDPPDYQVGEKLGTALRTMDEPARGGFADSCWAPDVGTHDEHDASGVGNKFFYLLAVGSGKSAWGDSPTCAGAPAVTGIGNDKAGRIWYRALTTYMLSNTNFAGAREATLTAAADLYGAGSAEFTTVNSAWKAVNVDGSLPVPQEPAVWSPGDQGTDVGTAVHLRIRAEDPQGDAITFTATDLPDGLSISADGLISGVPTTAGWEYVQISATDSAGHVGVTSFFWDVYGAPVVTEPGNRSSAVGEFVALSISASDDDPAPDLVYTYAGLPDGMEASGSLVFGRPERAGTWQVTVTVTDSDQSSTTVTFVWTITG